MFCQQLQLFSEEYDFAIIFTLCVLQIIQTVLQTAMSMFSFSERVGKSVISDLTRAIRLTSCDMHRRGPVNRSANYDAVTDFPSRLTVVDRSSFTLMQALMLGMLSDTCSKNISSSVSNLVTVNPSGRAVSVYNFSTTSSSERLDILSVS